MIEALLKTLREIFTPFFLKLFLINLIITGAFFAGLVFAIGEVVTYYANDYEWVTDVAQIGGVIVAFLLFPIIFPLFSYLFQDYVAKHLNKKHNQNFKGFDVPVSKAIRLAIKFSVISLSLNIILLPFYFIPVFGWLAYFCLNSYLLGKEYYYLSAFTLFKYEEIKPNGKILRTQIFLSGVLFSFAFLTPILNLTAPLTCVIFSWFYLNKFRKSQIMGTQTENVEDEVMHEPKPKLKRPRVVSDDL